MFQKIGKKTLCLGTIVSMFLLVSFAPPAPVETELNPIAIEFSFSDETVNTTFLLSTVENNVETVGEIYTLGTDPSLINMR